ncbi:MAG TPA: hypothetical protein PK890_10570, partial [Terrimesophilobacter sp.]|nr:hypothetical protein [Terrimesophilobacter sp.]
PTGPPAEFIRIIVTDGVERDLVTDLPQVTVECFAKKESRASRLADVSRAILVAAGRAGSLGGVTCYGVDIVARPQNLPSATVTGRTR